MRSILCYQSPSVFRRGLSVLTVLICGIIACAARAQDAAVSDNAEYGEAAGSISALKAIKEKKTLVFVFDVSGSMNDQGNLRRARAAAVNILRAGAAPGDHVAMLTFGAGTKKVFDTTLETRADLPDLIDKVPSHTEPGAGTNIRKPHHQALKIVDAGLPRPGVIILLTDSFNDEPKPEDTDYPQYLKYYTPGGMLKKYPNTAENRDYVRLLGKLLKSGQQQFGIGINVEDDGRPIERLPLAAPPPVQEKETPAVVETYTGPPPTAGPNIPWPVIGIGVVAAAVAGFILAPLMRTSAVRVTGGPGGAKDFQIKNGQSVRIGGDGAGAAFDAYAIPTGKDAAALVRAQRGQLFIAPFAATGNIETAARVYHNGLALEREEPLNFGDEVRVTPASAPGAVSKEYRLKFEDPRKGY